MIGTFGDIVFVASADLIRTIDNFQRTTAARWAVHDVHQHAPQAEYLGPGQDSITFEMRFDVRYGMRPLEEMDRLLEKCRSGQAETLIVGGKSPGVDRWYIESTVQKWQTVDNHGNVLIGVVSVTLKEYVQREGA